MSELYVEDTDGINASTSVGWQYGVKLAGGRTIYGRSSRFSRDVTDGVQYRRTVTYGPWEPVGGAA